MDESQPPTGSSGASQDRPSSPGAPSISLPKGGGAIRGIGEKFGANPVTGTGSMSVPIATSPGRAGFGPQLALSYDSGAGNGPYGFGWNLSLPSITRKTDKGLPQYNDAVESDVFILSGAEDLVPVFKKDTDGNWLKDEQGKFIFDEETIDGHRVRRYRSRIEGLFARIERWINLADPTDVHWRSISKDNILTLYGKDTNSCIVDPADGRRIFSWLICETRDDKGNGVVYEYKSEDGAGVDLSQAHEGNRGARDDPRRTANRYLKRIKYGNRAPLLDNAGQRPRFLTVAQTQNAGWMFEAVLDYGEHHADAPQPSDNPATSNSVVWPVRNDPFSTYRAGFEVRTYRLCQRVLMFHHIPDLPSGEKGYDGLVRSTDFTYSYEQNPTAARNPIYSFLLSVTQSGYKRQNGGYLKRSLPPLEFEYSQPVVQDKVEEVDPASLENLPIGLDGAAYQWTDLHGEGIPGILTEQAGAWFYKRNVSPTSERPVEFAPLELAATKPNLALAGGAQFMDLAGDGQPDLAVMDGPMPGLYEHDDAEGWQPFRPFTARLNRDMRDPNLKFVDLDGDGHADVLITEADAFVWHASLAEEGFDAARRVAQALAEEKGPRLVFADGTQSIYLADLSGDGLTDLARIRNGEACYWPNLGYGRFGAKVSMDNAPWLDNPDQFDQKRIRLADIDGSGTTDIIYLHRDGVRLYFNQSGNSWSAPQTLSVFPRVDELVSLMPTDLLGNGTACLVWSSSLPGDAGRQMRYVNLMGAGAGQKPHLLVKTVNNLGAETLVHYTPSTEFYLRDKRDGKPWITRLPFPVHVVERVETHDHISRNRFVARYAYHHGYFDGEEREFRGFGMVEQWDTEEFAALNTSGSFPSATNIDEASHVPPVHTKTWFHTGAYLGRGHISDFFAGLLNAQDLGEYYREPGLTDQEAANLGLDDEARRLYDDAQARALLLPDTVLPPGLSLEEEREACRALKGAMLRQEVYADDAEPSATAEHIQRARTPYTVAEQNFTIKLLQPQDGNHHAVFFTHPCEAITYHYERNPEDPRIGHALTLEVDRFGNVLRSLAIGYPRADVPERLPEQNETHLTLTLNRFANHDDQADWYRVGLPVESRTYEVVKPPTAARRFKRQDLSDLVTALVPLDQDEPPAAMTIPYEQWDWRKQWNPQSEPGGFVNDVVANTRLRLIEHVRTLYRPDDMGEAQNSPLALLPLGTVKPLVLPGESYKLALTPGLLSKVFRRDDQPLLPDLSAVLGQEGRYVRSKEQKALGLFPEGDPDDIWWIPAGRVYYYTDPNADSTRELAEARLHFFLPRRFVDPFDQSTTVDYDDHDLLLARTEDALHNTITATNDYRVLQPGLVTDPNNNRTQVAFDALGLVVATAVMGKEGENVGDILEDFDIDPPLADRQAFVADPHGQSAVLLGKATARIVYDLERYERTGQPPFAATLARETHFHDPGGPQTRIQLSFSYSDGFGREIQKKIQAEGGDAPQREANVLLPDTGDIRPGDLVRDAQGKVVEANTPRRWVGTGRTVFNNKGKPVRQYEPFFSATHLYEPEPDMTDTGVSPVLFYDPVERVIATLHPNHTYEKVVFDPWQQTTYDVNDTVAASGTQTGDPRTDPDIAGYMREYFKTQPATWQTWHAQRIGNPIGDPERDAAQKAAAHAGTPAVVHLDALGRPFLTLADNGPDPAQPANHLFFATRVELDIEGNQRAVIDARDHTVMAYDYDMLGNRIRQVSTDAGTRWMLANVAGKPIRGWDSREHTIRTTYDALQRPLATWLQTASDMPQLVERVVYGEVHPEASTLNLRSKAFMQLDGAGVLTNEAYDFKGNLLRSSRQLAREFKELMDWQAIETSLSATPPDTLDLDAIATALAPLREAKSFTTSTTYDALNRPLTLTTPDNSVIRPSYNEANLLERIEANLRGEATATTFVDDIDYNAKGQRTFIAYGNETHTDYTYDRETYRLITLKTLRPNFEVEKRRIQDLSYTYDPAGNITAIRDDAQRRVFFDNDCIDASNDYQYDALYRLIGAAGREHKGQDLQPDWDDSPRIGNSIPYNCLELRRYAEIYHYDEVGNILRMIHHLGDNLNSPGTVVWNRRYQYQPDNNRLRCTSVPGEADHSEYSDDPFAQYASRYSYDDHGNMTSMPHLPLMEWDHTDQLHATSQQVRDDGGTPEITYYVYDAAGQRVRKVTERPADPGITPTRKEERVYLGGFEVYRKYNGSNGNDPTLVRETLHIMDDKQRIALVETRTQGNDGSPAQLIRYQFSNHLGSASLELDEVGEVISYEEYYPYGSTSYQAVRKDIEVPAKRYRYTGKERDEESGLNYHGARYHALWLGRWITADSEDVADGPNLYAYTTNNPLKFTDETGHYKVQAVKGRTSEIGKHIVRLFEDEEFRKKVRGKGRKEESTGINIRLRPFGPFERTESNDPSYLKPYAGEGLGYTYCVAATWMYAIKAIEQVNKEEKDYGFGKIKPGRYEKLLRFQQLWYRSASDLPHGGFGAPRALVEMGLGYEVENLRDELLPGAVINLYGMPWSLPSEHGQTGPNVNQGTSLIFLEYGTQKSLPDQLKEIWNKNDSGFFGKLGASVVTIWNAFWNWLTGSGKEGIQAIHQGEKKFYSFEELEKRRAKAANWYPVE